MNDRRPPDKEHIGLILEFQRLASDAGLEVEVSSGLLDAYRHPASTPIGEPTVSVAAARRALRDLASVDSDRRISALMTIVGAPPTPEIVEHLRTILITDDVHRRAFAAQALGVIGDQDSWDQVVGVLSEIVDSRADDLAVAGMAAAIGLTNLAVQFPERSREAIDHLRLSESRVVGPFQDTLRALVAELDDHHESGMRSAEES